MLVEICIIEVQLLIPSSVNPCQVGYLPCQMINSIEQATCHSTCSDYLWYHISTRIFKAQAQAFHFVQPAEKGTFEQSVNAAAKLVQNLTLQGPPKTGKASGVKEENVNGNALAAWSGARID